MKSSSIVLGIFAVSALAVMPASAEAPNLKTPGPVIYLSDNLDEADNLGWCIDTLGRDFAEKLQAHSCKPQGGDVQFKLQPETGLIQSVAFEDYCMEHAPDDDAVFSLNQCDAANPKQRFSYNSENGAISPTSDDAQCVVVGEGSSSAGPFMSRQLLMAACADTTAALREWTVLDD
jgi:hypothetical protein